MNPITPGGSTRKLRVDPAAASESAAEPATPVVPSSPAHLITPTPVSAETFEDFDPARAAALAPGAHRAVPGKDPFTEGGAPIFPLALAGKEGQEVFNQVCTACPDFCRSHSIEEETLLKALAIVPDAKAATLALLHRPDFAQAAPADRTQRLLAFVRSGDWAPASVASAPLPAPRTSVQLEPARMRAELTDPESGKVHSLSYLAQPATEGWSPSESDLRSALAALPFHASMNLSQVLLLPTALFQEKDVAECDPILAPGGAGARPLWMIPLESGIEIQPLPTAVSSAEVAGGLLECTGQLAAHRHFGAAGWKAYGEAAEKDGNFVSREAGQSLMHDFRQTWKLYHQLEGDAHVTASLVLPARFELIKGFVAQLKELTPAF